ncbi:MAG TPA: YicC/YloC family endoribonuclease [Longimicrobiales bacterium]|nr:YicC/YloC family endoribonuclease [Longimicrobiales bacterium]
MIRSMTGYGEAEQDTPYGRMRAEVRTVNHRYFSANLRLASIFERFEPQIREWLRASFPRGHVNFSLRLEGVTAANGSSPLVLDVDRARAYLALLRDLKERLGLPGEIDVALLSGFGDLFRPGDLLESAPLEPDLVQAVTDAAARSAISMREQEGDRLELDLQGRLSAIEGALHEIRERAPARLIAERDRLRKAVTELAGSVGADEERLAREIAYAAERWDISEEIVRLSSHIDLFRQTLAASADEPVGKRLGFLTQEMHRETNTIGSKANDATIEHRVIAIKEELERLREQIENVE